MYKRQNNHRIIKVNDCYASIVIKGLNKPTGICVKNKKLYITDTGNDIVLKHDLVKDKTHIKMCLRDSLKFLQNPR